ncbi:MAG: hypothetical protein RLP14_02665 [Owenweeksia sp.]
MKYLTCFLFLLLTFASRAQNNNPYKGLGEEGEKLGQKILTLSNGKYNEFHDNDTIVQIGSLLYNVLTRDVVGVVEYETQYS